MAEASSTEDVITLRIRFKSDSLEKFTERYAADLTQNEIFIRTRDPLPVGTTLALDLSLHDGSSLITGRGLVAWTRGSESTRDAPAGMGIRFEALTGGSRQTLARILEAKARLAGNLPAFPAPPERTDPPRSSGSSADLPVAVGRPTDRTAPPRPARQSARMPAVTTAPPAASRPAATTSPSLPAPTVPSARSSGTLPVPAAATPRHTPVATPPGPTRPMRGAFLEQKGEEQDEAEQTELARIPPNFFYEGADADQEKTRLQDPRASAALLAQQQMLEDEDLEDEEDDLIGDDDVTNVRSAASLYGGVAPPADDPNPLPATFTPGQSVRNDWAAPARPDRSGVRNEIRPEQRPDQRRRTPASTPTYGAPSPATPERPDRSGVRNDRPEQREQQRRTPASTPSYGAPSSGSLERPDRSGLRNEVRPERRTPPSLPGFGTSIPAITREIKAPVPPMVTDNLTDHHPLILSTSTDEPMTPDPQPMWPPPLPQSGGMSGGMSGLPPSYDPYPPDPQSPPVGEQRWGAGTLETMTTAPSLPAIGNVDGHAMATPAWPVPAADPAARVSLSHPIQQQEEEPGSRMSSVKTWAALALAAGGLVAAALLLLPALLRPSPAPTASAPAESQPAQPSTPAEPPPPVQGEPAGAPAADPAKQAAAPAAEPPPAAAPSQGSGAATPAEGARPPAPPAAAAREAAPAPPPAASERPAPRRPARGNRRSTRDVIIAAEARERAETPPPAPPPAAPAEPSAAAKPAVAPTAPATPPPGEGADDVYWLTVRSIPSGADVLIDGQVEGQTPFVRRIFDPTRSYALTVRRPGFEPHDRTLSTSDVWTKRGNVRTLTVVAKLAPASGLPSQGEAPPPVSPTRGADPTTPAEPSVGPPPVEPDRKTNPFAEPGAPGGNQPQ